MGFACGNTLFAMGCAFGFTHLYYTAPLRGCDKG
jgi:hypothetical protein